MFFLWKLIEDFKRPVVALESVDARPAPIDRREPIAVGSAAVSARDRGLHPDELRHGC